MNCRGEDARRRIVADYHLTPVAHTRLLPGQSKVSCAGPVLTDSYYCFSYESKLDAKDKGTFICGNDSGRDFLDLLGQPNLPLFDPLLNDDIQGNGAGGDGGQHNAGVARVWNPVARQLWEVINMVIVCRSNPVNGLLLEIKNELDNEPQTSPIYSKIKSANTIVGKLFQTPTFSQKINAIRAKHPRLRQYHWDLLNEILASKNIASNFP